MKDKNTIKDKFFSKKMLIIYLIAIIIIVLGIIICYNQLNKQANENAIGKDVEFTPINEVNTGIIDMQNSQNVKIQEGKKINNSEELLKDKEFEGMKVTQINLEAKDGITNFTATVENNTEKDFSAKSIKIVFTDNNGVEYAILEGFLGDIKAGGINYIDASTTADIANAYNFTINISK